MRFGGLSDGRRAEVTNKWGAFDVDLKNKGDLMNKAYMKRIRLSYWQICN